MITAILLFVLVALAVGFAVAPGLGPFAALPGVLAIAFVIWLVVGLRKGRTPAGAVRRARRPELLGPGGPDDPDQ